MSAQYNHSQIKKFVTSHDVYYAENCIDGILVNPVLPLALRYLFFAQKEMNFEGLEFWLDRPYVETLETGVYRVSCVHATSIYAPTVHCHFQLLDHAVQFCKNLIKSVGGVL
jgi:hypothetical protein